MPHFCIACAMPVPCLQLHVDTHISVCNAPGRERATEHGPQKSQLTRQAARSRLVALLWYNIPRLPASISLPRGQVTLAILIFACLKAGHAPVRLMLQSLTPLVA